MNWTLAAYKGVGSSIFRYRAWDGVSLGGFCAEIGIVYTFFNQDCPLFTLWNL